MFTIDDIREIAVQIERNGEEAYRRAAAEIKHADVGELFTHMADEERKHREWFNTIQSNRELTGEELVLEQMGRNLLQEMVADQTFSLDGSELTEIHNFAEMLEQSQAFEQDTILFYEFLQGIIDDQEVRQQLDLIIAEERRHVKQLAELHAVLQRGEDDGAEV